VVNCIHHTGVVVRSREEAYAFFRDTLGLTLLKEALLDDQGVKAALLDLGNSLLELLEPVDPDTGIGRYLERRGEGLHHVCLEVAGIEITLADLKAKGVPLVDEEPREGMVGSIAFLHPSALHGVLVELVHAASAFAHDGPTGPGRVQRLDHLVFAVQDAEPAISAWAETFGLRAEAPIRPEGTHMELTFLPLSGPDGLGAFLELVQPMTEDHRVARYLAEEGEGMFSISLQVDDVAAAVRDLRAKGAAVSDPEAGVLPNSRIARIPRDAAHGVAVQLIERDGVGG
jgi:methylmalonyl-CoA epimerase